MCQDSSSLAGRYLALALGRESCAVPVHRIREIIRFPGFPCARPGPEPVEGIVHLRGLAIPVVDLRVAFGLPATEATTGTCIVVVEVSGSPAGTEWVGLLVDAVEEIIQLESGGISSARELGTRLDAECLLGVARVEGAVRALLDRKSVV